MLPEVEDAIPPNMKQTIEFTDNTFRTRYTGETEKITGLRGVEGNDITDGLEFDLVKNKEGYLPGVLKPLDGGVPILFYPDGGVAATCVRGAYKLVYLAFYLNDIASVETKTLLLQKILDWFNKE